MMTFGLVSLFGLTSFDDIRTKQVRVLEIIIFAVFGIILNIYYRTNSLTSIMGGLMIGGVIYLFSIVSKEKIGKGDALIIMVSGLYLGFFDTLILLWLASVFAAVFGGIYMLAHKNKGDIELPFVPFLLLGYMTMFSVETIVEIIAL